MPFYVLKLGGSLINSAKDLICALLSINDVLLYENGQEQEKPEDDIYNFLVVPGGGPMADLVRDIFSRGDLSQEAAHWMAVLAMEQYAYLLADGTGAMLTDEICRPNEDGIGKTNGKDAKKREANANVSILLPYKALRSDDFGIEHNWDYTSDAAAALIAAKLSAPLIKATDVDGIFIGKEDESVQAGIEARTGAGTDARKDAGTGAKKFSRKPEKEAANQPVQEVAASRLMGRESCLDQGTIRLLCGQLKGSSIWILNGSDPQRFILSLKRGEGGTVVKG